MRNKIIYTFMLFSISYSVCAQNQNSIVNEGKLYISSDDLVSFENTFKNQDQGYFVNDGVVIYFEDFINQGYYGITQSKQTSKTRFISSSINAPSKMLGGTGLSSFYDIEFDVVSGIDLKSNIEVYGEANFKNGIIKVDQSIDVTTRLSKGIISFMPKSEHINVSDNSYVEGLVEKVGKEAFIFPIGAEQMYRPAKITAPAKDKDIFTSEYFINNPSFFELKTNTAGVIKELNKNEYWLIEKGNNLQSDVLITLSWKEGVTPVELLNNSEEELHIIRWDEEQQLWVDEGGVVDMSSKTVTTPTSVKGYGYFTFAIVKKDWMLDGDVVIYNLVSSNGDGKNDYFMIDNINKYPNNKVEIFNRWGTKVYETTNYDNNGDGSTNVFTGYSEGRVIIGKNNKLPSGTYYYVLTYEYKDDNGSRMIRKAANLHLETN